MSDGLRLISAVVQAGAGATLLRLERDLFTDAEHAAYDFVRDFFRRFQSVPSAQTVQQETGMRLPAAPENVAFYAEQVETRHTYTQVLERYSELRDAMRTRSIDEMRPIINGMHQAVSAHRERGHVVMGVGGALQLVTERLQRTMGRGGITGIETPWESFNEMTGGYQDADLITIVGRPGTAKTYNILTQAMQAHDTGRSVLVVTTEMGIEQLGRRYAALKTGVNPELLKRNMISTYMMRRIEALGAEMMSDERLRFFSVGMGAKINAIEGLMQEFDPEVVFLDGTYLVHPSVKQPMKRIERVGEVFDELKGLTISANRPIINTMQFNRQAGKDGKDGSLENIGFTDAVGMHSSLVIGLKMGPTENPRVSRTMEFLKGREGEIGQVHMNFKFAPVDMSELIVDNSDGTTPGAPGAAGDAGVDWMM